MTASGPTVGIVGLGFGRAHIPGFQAAGCRVMALCQRDETAARTIADKYGVPHVYARWEEMLDKAKPDIVVIATPPFLHKAIALRAFEVGAHVLCEKPLAMSRAEGRAMLEAAAWFKRVAMTGFNWRFPPAVQELHARVEAGALGRPFHVYSRWLGARYADESAPATWRLDRSQAGLGAMGDMGVHLIDLVQWNFGELTRVCAQAGRAYPERTLPGGAKPADAEDFCTVLGELASGAQMTLMANRAARGANETSLEVYGARGAFRCLIDRQKPRWWIGQLDVAGESGALAPVTVPGAPPDSVGEGDPMEVIGKATIAPLVRRMLEGIRTGTTPSPSLADGLQAQAVLDAVSESLHRGDWVAVSPVSS
jgi:predicted dehydrogenase